MSSVGDKNASATGVASRKSWFEVHQGSDPHLQDVFSRLALPRGRATFFDLVGPQARLDPEKETAFAPPVRWKQTEQTDLDTVSGCHP